MTLKYRRPIFILNFVFVTMPTKKIILFFLILCLHTSCKQDSVLISHGSTRAEKGIIDLRNIDFNSSSSTVKLHGEWDFYWNRFIHSEKQRTETPDSIKRIYNLPGYWTNSGQKEVYGYGTAHLTILLPKDTAPLAIKLNMVMSAYELWADGQLLTAVGEISSTKEGEKPQTKTKWIELPQAEELHLFLNLSNHAYRRGGGVAHQVEIGNYEVIRQNWLHQLLIEASVAAMIFIIGFYHLFYFILYKKQKVYLYLALVAFAAVIRQACIGEIFLMELLPNCSFYLLHKLRIVIVDFITGLVILYVQNLFPGKFTRKITSITVVFTFLLGVYHLIIPIQWIGIFALVIQFIIIVSIIGFLLSYKSFDTHIDKLLFGTFGSIASIIIIHDVLVISRIIEGRFIFSAGMLIVVVAQAILLAYRNRLNYLKINTLSGALQDLNKGLEQKVEDRVVEIKTQQIQIQQQAEELQVANEQLTQLDKAKSKFFANISHELRTPLTMILGSLQLLKEEKPQPIEHPAIDMAKKYSHSLQQLINQLLDVTKLESGKMELQLSLHPLIQLVKEFVLPFETIAQQRKINLVLEIETEECEGWVDGEKLQKIINNLLSNALKFTPEQGEVTVSINASISNLYFTIKDTGIGISKEQLPFIFNRFYQADASLIKNYEGTGIGLALVKELVTLHGGEIHVESVLGKGTTFQLTLPVVQSSVSNTMTQPQKPVVLDEFVDFPETVLPTNENKIETAKTTLLIVEDHVDLHQLLRNYLQEDYQLLAAYDGEQGVEMCLTHSPDLVISDVMMPKKSGYELCQELKQDMRTSHIPIILLTAKATHEDKLEGLAIGANDYLSKPFDMKEVKLRIHNLLAAQASWKARFSNADIHLAKEIAPNDLEQQFIDKLYEVLEENYARSEFNAGQLVEKMDMTKQQLNHKLKSLLDTSSIKILRNYRLQKAKELVLNSSLTISEICFAVGFAHKSHFIKSFKEIFGDTPKVYRDQYHNISPT